MRFVSIGCSYKIVASAAKSSCRSARTSPFAWIYSALQGIPAAAIPASAAVLQSNAAGQIENNAEVSNGASSEAPKAGQIVKAPLVGVFYAAPAEDAAPFVSVGDRVKKGQTLAIIEAMKLMNEIDSEFDGTIAEILVENGQAVEYGQPLFRIEA